MQMTWTLSIGWNGPLSDEYFPDVIRKNQLYSNLTIYDYMLQNCITVRWVDLELFAENDSTKLVNELMTDSQIFLVLTESKAVNEDTVKIRQ